MWAGKIAASASAHLSLGFRKCRHRAFGIQFRRCSNHHEPIRPSHLIFPGPTINSPFSFAVLLRRDSSNSSE